MKIKSVILKSSSENEKVSNLENKFQEKDNDHEFSQLYFIELSEILNKLPKNFNPNKTYLIFNQNGNNEFMTTSIEIFENNEKTI